MLRDRRNFSLPILLHVKSLNIRMRIGLRKTAVSRQVKLISRKSRDVDKGPLIIARDSAPDYPGIIIYIYIERQKELFF